MHPSAYLGRQDLFIHSFTQPIIMEGLGYA